MRTCPACGEDTKSSYAEPCTECGFSPFGEQPDESAPAAEPLTAAEPVPTADPAPTTEVPFPPPEPAPAEQKKRSPARWLVWLVVIVGFFGAERLGLFDAPTGPKADEVEQAIADSAPAGLEITVDCPDDAEDTPVDGTFSCTATDSRGRTIEIVVTNHEDTFEWQSGPLGTLS